MLLNILWDLDGTIFDTYPTIIQALQKAAGKKLDEIQLLTLLKENSIVAFEFFGLDNTVRTRFKEIERQIPPNKKPPFPFVEEVLNQSDINVIVTHKDKKSVRDLLRYWKFEHYFNEILCLENSSFPRKPESDSYEYLHKKYKIDLVIGDRSLDLIPAQKLGIPTCSFRNRNIQADFYIHSYKEFPKVKEALLREKSL